MQRKESEAAAEKENGGDIEQGSRIDDDTTSDSAASRKSEIIDYTKCDEYNQLTTEVKKNLVRATRLQLKNSSALVRRVAVLLLDFLGTTTLDINDILKSHVS